MKTLINLDDIENAARRRLDPKVYDFIAGGAEDEVTLKRNRDIFKNIQLLPRVLSGSAACNTAINIMGIPLDLPIITAPIALMSLVHPEGEMAVARAVARAGLAFSVSTLSSYRLEDIASHSDGPKLFQMYLFKDRSLSLKMLEKAHLSNYSGIIVTVDTPGMGRRERDMRNHFSIPDTLKAANLSDLGSDIFQKNQTMSLKGFTDEYFEKNLIWQDIIDLRKNCHLPLIIKGIIRPSDAQRAYDCGADAIVISNHGGRQQDGVPSAVEMLPLINNLVGDKLPILCDGGFRRGTDILKALALGASAIMLGRPIIWGLANNGEQGVVKVFSILKHELMDSLKLCGYDTIADLKQDGKALVKYFFDMA